MGTENTEKSSKDYKELIREMLADMLKPWQNSTSIVASIGSCQARCNKQRLPFPPGSSATLSPTSWI